jgi:GNAT superfamily N-acetyltransferase
MRAARCTDIAAVLRLYAQPDIDAGQVLSLDEAKAIFRKFRRYPDYHLYVATLDSRVVGTYALLIMDNLAHRGARSGVVEDVMVAPELHGRGIGRQMMEHALERCAAAECYKLALSSNLRRTAAHRFYEGLGFERHGYSFLIRIPTGRQTHEPAQPR